MKKLFLIILASLIIIDIGTACFSKKPDPDPTFVTLTVLPGSSMATGQATINLYNSMADLNNGIAAYTQTGDSYNQFSFQVDYQEQYYVVATLGPAKNYYNGLIPIGTFISQYDINNSPAQNPAGVIGGVKFKDVNGDGVINNNDKTSAPVITLRQGTTNMQSIIVY